MLKPKMQFLKSEVESKTTRKRKQPEPDQIILTPASRSAEKLLDGKLQASLIEGMMHIAQSSHTLRIAFLDNLDNTYTMTCTGFQQPISFRDLWTLLTVTVKAIYMRECVFQFTNGSHTHPTLEVRFAVQPQLHLSATKETQVFRKTSKPPSDLKVPTAFAIRDERMSECDSNAIRSALTYMLTYDADDMPLDLTWSLSDANSAAVVSAADRSHKPGPAAFKRMHINVTGLYRVTGDQLWTLFDMFPYYMADIYIHPAQSAIIATMTSCSSPLHTVWTRQQPKTLKPQSRAELGDQLSDGD